MTAPVRSITVTTYTSLVSMTRAEARAYLAQFLAEMPTCFERLKQQCADTGGPQESELDFTPESLEGLWDWAAPRFRWRETYTPPASPGELRRQFDPDDLEPPEELPSWFHHPSGHGLAEFSAETLWLIDSVGRYLGQTVVDSVPNTRWTLGASRPKGNMLANQPVLGGLSYEVSPLITCVVLTSQTLTEWEQTTPLFEAYEQYVTLAQHDA